MALQLGWGSRTAGTAATVILGRTAGTAAAVILGGTAGTAAAVILGGEARGGTVVAATVVGEGGGDTKGCSNSCARTVSGHWMEQFRRAPDTYPVSVGGEYVE